MLKTISAALLAASMIAAPALAAESGSQSPAGKTTQTQAAQPQAQTPAGKTNASVTSSKSKKLNANAKMIRHHPHHKKIGLHKGHSKVASKITTKSVAPSTKHS